MHMIPQNLSGATLNRPIYLDYNATTPHAREVVAAMRPYLEGRFGNPSSAHVYGRAAREAVELARKQVAAALGAQPDEIVFTSGGTESNNHALKGAALARREQGRHLITSAIEHPAVLEVCAFLEANGFEITRLPVDETGLVDPSVLARTMRPGTIAVSIMHANNEVGTIQPIRALADIAHAHGALLHTDAAQSLGKIPVDVDDLGVDLLSVAGHKVYAPKGVGALYIRSGVTLERFMHGAGHERGLRAGTENVMEIVGLGQACEVAERDLEKNRAHLQRVTDQLFGLLSARLPELRLNGHPEKRLPNTLNLSFLGIESPRLLALLDDHVALSGGSACHSGGVNTSPVLAAMGVAPDWAVGAVRFSTGRMTTPREIATAVESVVGAVETCRRASSCDAAQ